MSEDFLKNLKDKNVVLYNIANERSCIILVPNNFTEKGNLNQKFFCNHIFFKDKYDESILINFNGRAIKMEDNKFVSYFGWKRDKQQQKRMEFNIKDTFADGKVSYYQIDNICDDILYNDTMKIENANKPKVHKCFSLEEYIDTYKPEKMDDIDKGGNIIKVNNEFRKSLDDVELLINKMSGTIILMKGYEKNYGANYQEEIYNLREKMGKSLNPNTNNTNINLTDSLITICNELIQSLFFNKLYDFIFNKLVEFNEDIENKFIETFKKDKKEKKNFELKNFKLDRCFYDMKFEKSIEKFKEISTKKTPFEKTDIIKEVFKLIQEEAMNRYREVNKKEFTIETDDFLSFWTYILSHGNIPNINAETLFLEMFDIPSTFGDDKSFLLTTFYSAVKSINEIVEKSNVEEEKKTINQKINAFNIVTMDFK